MRSVFMRYPGGKAKAVTFSYDDGVPQDKRLAELFDKYEIKATFNFNNVKMKENYSKQEIKEIFLSKGHEIAVHGANHRANGNMRAIEGIRDVLDCRLQLEERCDSIIRGMAYPDTGITQMGNFGNYAQIKNYLNTEGRFSCVVFLIFKSSIKLSETALLENYTNKDYLLDKLVV